MSVPCNSSNGVPQVAAAFARRPVDPWNALISATAVLLSAPLTVLPLFARFLRRLAAARR